MMEKHPWEVLVSKDQWYGVTYPEDKESVIEALAALREMVLTNSNTTKKS